MSTYTSFIEYNNFIIKNNKITRNNINERLKYIKTINKLKEFGFNCFNDKWNINFNKVLIDFELYEYNIKKHVKNNNLDIIKFLYYNNIDICSNSILNYSIKYNKLDILKFIHITCTKKCKLIENNSNNNKIHNWLNINCIYYEK